MLTLLAARRNTDPMALVLVIVGMALVCALVWYFSKAQRLKRRLRSAPIRSISQLCHDEQGRVVGTARTHGDTLTAPLTGRTCLYYRVEVEERKGKHWATILDEARGVAFVVDDGTGRVLVDPNRADVVLDFDRQSASGTFKDADGAQDALLARHGRGSTGLLFNRSLRYREAIIEVGERIAVLGRCRRDAHPKSRADAEASGAPAIPLSLVSTREARLVISDARSTTEG